MTHYGHRRAGSEVRAPFRVAGSNAMRVFFSHIRRDPFWFAKRT
jgi:hypothetical protein